VTPAAADAADVYHTGDRQVSPRSLSCLQDDKLTDDWRHQRGRILQKNLAIKEVRRVRIYAIFLNVFEFLFIISILRLTLTAAALSSVTRRHYTAKQQRSHQSCSLREMRRATMVHA